MEKPCLRFLSGITFFLLVACGTRPGGGPSSLDRYDAPEPSGVTVNSTSDSRDNNEAAEPDSESVEETASANEEDASAGQSNDNENPSDAGTGSGNSSAEEEQGEGDDPAGEDSGNLGDGGSEAESESSQGESNGPADSSMSLANSCTFGDNASCPNGQMCASIFAAPGGTDIDTADSACYATCSSAGAVCTTATGLAGSCNVFSSGFLCVAEGATLGPCGNRMNSACGSDAPICLTEAGSSVGVCARICDPDNISTCRALTGAGCGCLEQQACSVSPMGISAPGGVVDGVCSSPSSIGDACGLDAETYLTQVCTSGQSCVTTMTGANMGSCQEP